MHTEENIPGSAIQLQLNHLHFRHRDVVRTEMTAVNSAGGHTTIPSSGYKVDLTNPLMEALVDGTDLANDQMFTVSNISIFIPSIQIHNLVLIAIGL